MSGAAPSRIALAVAVAAAVAYAPHDLRQVWRDVRNARAVPRAERELAPAQQVGIESAAAVRAAADVMPADAAYVLVVGPAAPLRDPSSADYVKFWASYSLLPRRRVDAVADASWVLAYGGGLRSLGVAYRRVVDLGGGVQAAEVRR